jgi:hypothetical protein
MHIATPERGVRVGWFPRAIVSGLSASLTTLFAFIIAYGLAMVLLGLLAGGGLGATLLGQWLYALTHNRVLDVGLASLYVAAAVYFAGGLLWAVLYARLAEPYVPGPDWWRGLLFAVVPALVSLVVVLPALGGGLFGLALGAGPLPVVGNLLLHAVYGTTLGLIYGPFGDRSAETLGQDDDEDRRAMAAAERVAARLTLVGGLVGLAMGLVPLLAMRADGSVLGAPPAAFMLATVLSGATLGAFVGSLAGLPGVARQEPEARR